MNQLFNNPNGHRGAAVVKLKMHEIYDLIRARLERVKGDFDPDALCQNICVEVEKHQGTFPNVQEMQSALTPAGGGEVVAWEDAPTAPKDGTMLRLLVLPDADAHTSFHDSGTPYETIGFNNLADTGDDEWQFAGWDWSHDCITQGFGEVIGWLPFNASPPPAPSKVVEALREVRDVFKVEYDGNGKVMSVGYDSNALRPLVALLDAALGEAP